MPVFDAYLMVDWSAANTPKLGKDSIWLGLTVRGRHGPKLMRLENTATRAAATERIIQLAINSRRRSRRILIGFDFPFGFPSGTARALGKRGLPWRNLWQELEDRLVDSNDNANNRFDVAESLNAALTGEAFPFWGLSREEARPLLLRRNRRPHGAGDLAEYRLCDLRIPSTQPVWKLAGAGSVGSQALTGIPRVWQLRKDPRIAFDCQIWPFETGLQFDKKSPILLAEIYPSLVPPRAIGNRPKDAGQVAAIGRRYAELDAADALAPLFEGDPSLAPKTKRQIELEEAWILGVRKSNAL
tara:strand:+ start:3332 stop:4231 length:900 start_codon:yes stop_codon:yes gene_type:complete